MSSAADWRKSRSVVKASFLRNKASLSSLSLSLPLSFSLAPSVSLFLPLSLSPFLYPAFLSSFPSFSLHPPLSLSLPPPPFSSPHLSVPLPFSRFLPSLSTFPSLYPSLLLFLSPSRSPSFLSPSSFSVSLPLSLPFSSSLLSLPLYSSIYLSFSSLSVQP